MANDPAAVRRNIRRQRAALPATQQRCLSQRITQHICQQRVFRNACHIALYLPVQGEADPTGLRNHALPRQRFYLPVIAQRQGKRQMHFVQWDENTRFRRNRFGISEPLLNFRQQRPARWLDLIITPLVAFDQYGTRLGMGGGFYDTTFAFKRRRPIKRHSPLLLGFAYAFQQVDQLHRQPWDVPLDLLATEQQFFHF